MQNDEWENYVLEKMKKEALDRINEKSDPAEKLSVFYDFAFRLWYRLWKLS